MKSISIHVFESSEKRISNLFIVRDDQESLELSRDLLSSLLFAIDHYEYYLNQYSYSNKSSANKVIEMDIYADNEIEHQISTIYERIAMIPNRDPSKLIAILIEFAVLDELENDTDDLYENCDGERVPYDDLSDAEQDFYNQGLNNEMDYDITQYSEGYNREAGMDWGNGPNGELADEDYDD